MENVRLGVGVCEYRVEREVFDPADLKDRGELETEVREDLVVVGAEY